MNNNHSSCLAVAGAITLHVALVFMGILVLRSAQKYITLQREENRISDNKRFNEILRETGQLN